MSSRSWRRAGARSRSSSPRSGYPAPPAASCSSASRNFTRRRNGPSWCRGGPGGDGPTAKAIFESMALGRIDSYVLRPGMSHYLIRELEAMPNVDVRLDTSVVGGHGDGRLERVVLRKASTGEEETLAADGLFVLIGAQPNSAWLPPELARDSRGFLLTGADLPDHEAWTLDRSPLLLETSMPGVFAAGDVRHGSVSAWPRRLARDPSQLSSCTSTCWARSAVALARPSERSRPRAAADQSTDQEPRTGKHGDRGFNGLPTSSQDLRQLGNAHVRKRRIPTCGLVSNGLYTYTYGVCVQNEFSDGFHGARIAYQYSNAGD